MFFRNSSRADNFSHIISYINICLSFIHYSLQNDILNHKDILCISFFNCDSTCFFINVYLDSSQTALKYLKNIEVNINNILIMAENFNIRDCLWNPNYPFHSSHKDVFFEITDFFYIELSKPTENLPTRYSNNTHNLNLVLDLVFLHLNSTELNNYHIYLE